MIVNAAVFTCSICGEPSTNICAYCTKDACRNHRCERCKRCSDCCECELPLSAEDTVVPEPALEPVLEMQEQEPLAVEVSEPELEPEAEASAYPFLTAEESSVFAPETVVEHNDLTEEREPHESANGPSSSDPLVR